MQPVSLLLASPICLDLINECLRYGAQTISLRPKTFAVLRCLIEHAQQLVSKTTLLEVVWPETMVSDGVLMVCIRELRQALGDNPRTPRFIATAHRRGYRFIGQVTREPASADAACLWLTPQGDLPTPAGLAVPPDGVVHRQQTFRQNTAEEGPRGTTPVAPAETCVGVPASVWEQKPVAVLVISLTFPVLGSLAAASYAPQHVASRWQQYIAEQVQRFGGVLLPGLPFLHVIAFGLPLTLDQMPHRAVQAALAIRHQVAAAARTSDAEPYPEVRLAVHVGEVLADVSAATPAQQYVGGTQHLDVGRRGDPLQEESGYGDKAPGSVGQVLALGETLALAVQLLGAAMPGDLLVSSQVGRTIESQYALQARALPVGVGSRNHSAAYAVVGGRPPSMPPAMPGVRLLSPFVGRERELAVLNEWLAQARHGRGQVIGLVGEPGVGKSRLIAELRRRHTTDTPPAAQEVLVLEGRCMAYGRLIPYLPVRDLLSACLHLPESTDGETLCLRLTEALQALDTALVPSLPALLALLDVPSDDPRWHALDPRQRRQQTLDAVKHLLLRASQHQPLLVIIEDAQWLDSETQALLDRLVDSLPTARLLLLVSYRPEYQHGWGSKTSYTQLRLDPLPLTSTEDLLQSLLGEDASLVPVKRLLIARIGGNPFFLEESLQALMETDVLVGVPGAYRLMQAVPTIQIPTTVQAVLAARIDRLPPEEKHLLQTAAVIGAEVPLPLLHLIAELPEAAFHGGLVHLQATEFLYETRLFPAHEYTFKHALTQEVAYNSVLQERRRVLHTRIVEALEALTGDRVAEQAERLAQHALQGEAWDKALTYCRQAGVKAFERAAFREAVTAYEQALRALAYLPEDGDTRILAIDLRLALAHTLRGEHGRRRTLFSEAADLARALDDWCKLVRALAELAQALVVTGDRDGAMTASQEAFDLAAALDDHVLQRLASQRLGQACHAIGGLDRAATLLRWSVEAADREAGTSSIAARIDARALLVLTLSDLGAFAEGRRYGEEALRLATLEGRDETPANIRSRLGRLYLAQGDLEHAIQVLEQGLALCRASGDWNLFRPTVASLGYAYVLQGRLAEGRTLLEEGVREGLRSGGVGNHACWVAWLSEVCRLAGHDEEAWQHARQALDLTRQIKNRKDEVRALHQLGTLHAHTAPPVIAQAEAYYQQALALAEEIGMRPFVAHCHHGLGTLYAKTGQAEQARAALALALALAMYQSMEMTFWLPETVAALAQVEGRSPRG